MQLIRTKRCLERMKDPRHFQYSAAQKMIGAWKATVKDVSDLNKFLDSDVATKLTKPIREELRMLVSGEIDDLADAKEKEARAGEGRMDPKVPRSQVASSSPEVASSLNGRAATFRAELQARQTPPVLPPSQRRPLNRSDLIDACRLRKDAARAQKKPQVYRQWLEAEQVLQASKAPRLTATDLGRLARSKDKPSEPGLLQHVMKTLEQILAHEAEVAPVKLREQAATANLAPEIPPCELNYRKPAAALLLAMQQLRDPQVPNWHATKDDIIAIAKSYTDVSFDPEPGTPRHGAPSTICCAVGWCFAQNPDLPRSMSSD